MMEVRWENEGGKPYEKIDFSVVNPRYFDFADRRLGRDIKAGRRLDACGFIGRCAQQIDPDGVTQRVNGPGVGQRQQLPIGAAKCLDHRKTPASRTKCR